MATISQHTNDWCHICGKRQQELADIWYPKNAEHDQEPTEYIRICGDCGQTIHQVALGELSGPVQTTDWHKPRP